MKKILIFIPSFEIGGAEKVMIILSNYFNKSNFIVKILVRERKGILDKLVDKNIEIISLNKKKLRYSPFIFNKILKTEKPDYLFTTIFSLNIFAVVFSKFYNHNNKIILRESIYLTEKFKEYSYFKKLILKQFITFFYNLSDFIIAPSYLLKSDLINNFKIKKEKIILIPNPIDYENIKKLSEEKLNNFKFNKSKTTLITVARLVKQKNILFLLNIVKELKNNYDLKLIIIGDGPEYKLINKMIKLYSLQDIVFLLGKKINPYKYICNSDIYVQSSLFEGSPNSLLHSISLNTPVVAFDCKSGPKEILENGKYGKLVNINDFESFKNAVEDLIKNPLKIHNTTFIEKYSPNIIVKEYIKYL